MPFVRFAPRDRAGVAHRARHRRGVSRPAAVIGEGHGIARVRSLALLTPDLSCPRHTGGDDDRKDLTSRAAAYCSPGGVGRCAWPNAMGPRFPPPPPPPRPARAGGARYLTPPLSQPASGPSPPTRSGSSALSHALPRTQSRVRLPPTVYDAVRAAAEQAHLTPSALIRQWVSERAEDTEQTDFAATVAALRRDIERLARLAPPG